jgi:Fic family protein
MTSGGDDRRHTSGPDAKLVKGREAIARAEARNGLLQFDLAMEALRDALDKGPSYKLRPSFVLALHRRALEQISDRAGTFRAASVTISQSDHKPPDVLQVASLLEDMCDYVNDHWTSKTPVHLSAYVMWRLNWIHPFSDGNGRTSRMLSYFVLCRALGYELPGKLTIPEQIVKNRTPYFQALEAADEAFSRSRVDISAMEVLIEKLLARQLLSAGDG